MSDVVCKKCGNVNDYRTEKMNMHLKAICNACESYIKHLPQSNEVTLYFGKYKGRTLDSLISKEELSWVQWAYRNAGIKPAQKEAFMKHLEKNQIGV